MTILSRAEIEERWIGCCSDPEVFKSELRALETAKQLGEWLEAVLAFAPVENMAGVNLRLAQKDAARAWLEGKK